MTTIDRVNGFSFVARDSRARDQAQWVQHWPSSDGPEPWLSAGRNERGYLLRFHGLADFEISPGERTIGVCPRSTSDPALVRRTALGQVLPRALSLESPPVLHASAVSRDGAALAIVGASRAGKSTLASALCAAGCSLLADDFVHVVEIGRVPMCRPTASAVWIDEHAVAWLAGAVRGAAAEAGAGCLRLVYVIEPVPEGVAPAMARLTARDALFALFGESYRLDPADPATLEREFDRLARLVNVVPAYRLRVPRGLAHLSDTLALMLGGLDDAAHR